MVRNWLTRVLIITILTGAVLALGQTTAPFLIRVQQGSTTATIVSGGTVGLLADSVGQTVGATISFQYQGRTSATISQVALTGGPEFSLVTPAVPAQLGPGEEYRFDVRFSPSSSRGATAQILVNFREGTASGSVTINLAGAIPELGVAFILQSDANAIPVEDGGTVVFPVTAVGSSISAVVSLLNRGSSPLEVRSVTLSQAGTEFQIQGLPLLPTFIDPGRDSRFNIRYSPRQRGSHAASLQVTTPSGTQTANIQASSSGPVLNYQLLEDDQTIVIRPGEPVTLPDTNLGETHSFVVRVTNDGDADAQIAGISVLGAGFQVADLPFLPHTLPQGSSVFFTLNFTPVQPGRVVGRMRIGNDTFEFQVTGLGPRLTFSVVNGGISTAIQPNGTLNFPPTAIGQSFNQAFSITNSGTRDALITTIATTSASEFAVLGVPALPTTLRPGDSLPLSLKFEPNATGLISSTFQVDSLAFNLSGIATPPPPLPGYRFEGATGSAEPQQQIAIGLTLDTPYPIPLNGTLTIGFQSDSFAGDPALQFITGGRTVNFTIPANTTQAIFSNNSNQIRLQTGTVAGSIVVTPGFTTRGGFNLTQTQPPSLTMNVRLQPPVLLAAEIASPRTDPLLSGLGQGLSLLVTGYATSRSLTRINLDFKPRSGFKLSGGQMILDVSSAASVWYRSAASQNFGSLFTAAIPIGLDGLSSNSVARDAIEAITFTLTNEHGTSSSITQQLP